MNIIPSWKLTVVSLVAGIAIGWYVQGLRWDADAAEVSRKQSDDISASQQAIIARQSFEFHRYNEIARNANQHGTIIKVNSNEKQVEYRTIIKRSPAGRECVSDDVAYRLLGYAHSLRAYAMHASSGGADTTDTRAITSDCRLTYAQAVYWIDPLLTALDQANSQLAGIRELNKFSSNQ
ncbi:hypothetical protein ACFFL1_09735 [Samsonia erythrinae]|uniref:Uncharacterized protein n=1 Tax=Samsonia erythrinae TaxID=160434 RepID=A0A4R3VNJ0_9GAMM|nr:hypothetical protein [Samsonia erythrinae]TCV06758.1 hypothetical protein EDC54_1032 [Samsonia erythrinae]